MKKEKNLQSEKKLSHWMKNLQKIKNRDLQQIDPEGLVVRSESAVWLDSETTGNPSEIGIMLDIPAKSFEFFLQRIPAGEGSDLQRHVHESVHYVLEGSGYSEIGDQIVTWSEGDFIYTPPWIWHRHYSSPNRDVRMLLVENSRLMDAMNTNLRESLGNVSFKDYFYKGEKA
ncbi:cupin domain-containing protein [Neobacillus niacini]|uniref:cupin domain-containing protein n=1 Tax=Neobacillus niacini TaxID=86668 RepID=UPI0030036B10